MGNYNWQAQLWALKAREQGYPEEYIESIVGKQDTYTGPTIKPAKPDYVRGKTISTKEKKKQEETQKAIAETKRAITRDLALGMGTNDPLAQEAVADVNSFLYNPSTALIGLNPVSGVAGMLGGHIGGSLLGDYMGREYGEAGQRFGTTLGGLIGGTIGGLFNPRGVKPSNVSTKKVYISPKISVTPVENNIATGDIGSSYIIKSTPGFLLRSFLMGNPLERFIRPDGQISTRTIRQYMSNPKRPLLDRRVVLYVLDNEFKGHDHIDYNLFRKTLLKYLVHPRVKVLNYGMQEGVMAAYPYPILIDEGGLEALRDDAVFMHVSGLIDDTRHSKNISKGLSASPQGNGIYKVINRRTHRAATAREIGHLLGSGNYLSSLQNKNFGEAYFNEEIPVAFLDENQKFLNRWYNYFGFNKDLHLSYFRDLNDPNILYSVDNKVFLPNYRTASQELKRFVIDPNNDINKSRAELATSAMTLARLKKTYPKMMLELKALPLTPAVQSAISELQYKLQCALAHHYWGGMLKSDPKRIIAVYHNLKHLNEMTLLRLLEMGEKLKVNKVRIPTRKTYKTVQFDDDGDLVPYDVNRFNSEKLARIYLNLFKKEVPVVTDEFGRTWIELEVPQNYLKSERIYKKGGKL